MKTIKTVAVIVALWGVGYLCLGPKDGHNSDLPSILQFAKETFVGAAVAWCIGGTAIYGLAFVCLIGLILWCLWLAIRECWKFNWVWKKRPPNTSKPLLSEQDLRDLIAAIHGKAEKAQFETLMARFGDLEFSNTNNVPTGISHVPYSWAGINFTLYFETHGLNQRGHDYLTKDLGFGAFDIRVPYLIADAESIIAADIQFSRPSLASFLNCNRGLVKWLLARFDEFYGRPANADWFSRDRVKTKGGTEYHFDAYKHPKENYARHEEWVSEWSLYDMPHSRVPDHSPGGQCRDLVIIRYRQRTARQIAECRRGAEGYRWVRGLSQSA